MMIRFAGRLFLCACLLAGARSAFASPSGCDAGAAKSPVQYGNYCGRIHVDVMGEGDSISVEGKSSEIFQCWDLEPNPDPQCPNSILTTYNDLLNGRIYTDMSVTAPEAKLYLVYGKDGMGRWEKKSAAQGFCTHDDVSMTCFENYPNPIDNYASQSEEIVFTKGKISIRGGGVTRDGVYHFWRGTFVFGQSQP